MPQATEPVEATIRARILEVFGDVGVPATDAQLLDAVFAGSDDAYEMAEAFRGRHWSAIPVRELYHHRQMLFTLSRTGFRACLPAYLTAALANDSTYGPDIQEFLVLGLHAIAKRDRVAPAARERMSALNLDQRAVVVSVLVYLYGRMGPWYAREIRELLTTWRIE